MHVLTTNSCCHVICTGNLTLIVNRHLTSNWKAVHLPPQALLCTYVLIFLDLKWLSTNVLITSWWFLKTFHLVNGKWTNWWPSDWGLLTQPTILWVVYLCNLTHMGHVLVRRIWVWMVLKLAWKESHGCAVGVGQMKPLFHIYFSS